MIEKPARERFRRNKEAFIGRTNASLSCEYYTI